MPIYEFDCPDCGGFSTMRPMAESKAPGRCPNCGTASRRVILSAPRLPRVSKATRVAHETNERSAHSPHTSTTYGGGHPTGCGCCSTASRPAGAASPTQTRTGARPWMISH
ncbi:MAG: zinc ribbon domain-containing protein [Salinisphaera sp.]|uniref:FmdB family zinc ribbon protein n=1 Tax=Salinisphaera sp. TaxID=1914330 RepID=UPI003C7CB7A6